MPATHTSATNPYPIPGEDGYVAPEDRKPEAAETAALRKQIAALQAQLAIQAPRDVTPDGQEERVFPRGTTVQEVHEWDRLEKERRLLEKGLSRPEAPLPAGTVTATAEEFSAAGV